MARLLFVDDDVRILNSLSAAFRRLHNVTTADSGDDALIKLRQESFDVIISDQRMPGIKGLELLAQAREQWPDTARILLAASINMEGEAESVSKADIFHYIQKPWSLDELSQIIDQAMIRKTDISSGKSVKDSVKVDTAQSITAPPEESTESIESTEDFFIAGIGNDSQIRHIFSDSISLDFIYNSAAEMAHKVPKSLSVTIILLDLSVVNEAFNHWMMMIRRKCPNVQIIALGQIQDGGNVSELMRDLQLYHWEAEPMSAEQSRSLITKALDAHQKGSTRH